MIPHNIPTLGKEEELAALRVLRSGWVAEGKEVEQFEREMCAFLGKKKGDAAAFSSGSTALYIALKVLGVGKGSEVIIPSYTCSAVLDAVFLAQAQPVLVDIGEEDLNISVEEAKKHISSKTKAIIATHTYGVPADMQGLKRLGVPIVEDAAQAIGATYNGKPAGVMGDIAVFSFGASKMLTSCNGGMVFSTKKALIQAAKDFREYDLRKGYKQRFNFQLSDLQAAVGREQLRKLPEFLRKRKKTALAYRNAFSAENVWPGEFSDRETNWYRFLLRSSNVRDLQKKFAKEGVETRIPLESFESLHRRLKLSAKKFPVSEHVSKTTLSLPIHPSLNAKEIAHIQQVGKKLL